MFAYCGNNPVIHIDPSGYYMVHVYVEDPIYLPICTTAQKAEEPSTSSSRTRQAIAIFGGLIGVILATNVPTKEEHYSRNKYQDDVMNQSPWDIIDSDEWEEQPYYANIYHRHTCGNQGINAKDNKKYISKDGRKEVIINFTSPDNPVFVTDPYNIGTYNYGTTRPTHFLRDMLPYYMWGNSETDAGLDFAFNRMIGAWN